MNGRTLTALIAGILQIGCAGAAVTEVEKQSHAQRVQAITRHVKEKGVDFVYAPGKTARVHEFSLSNVDYLVSFTQENNALQVSRRDFAGFSMDDFVDLESDGSCDLGIMDVDTYFRDERTIELIAKDSCVAIDPAKADDMRRVQQEYESVVETVFKKYSGE